MECLHSTVSDYATEQIEGEVAREVVKEPVETTPKKMGGPKATKAGRPRKKQ